MYCVHTADFPAIFVSSRHFRFDQSSCFARPRPLPTRLTMTMPPTAATTKFVCIGVTNDVSPTNGKPSSRQRSCPLISASCFTVSDIFPSQLQTGNEEARDIAEVASSSFSTSAVQLEHAIVSCLAFENGIPTAPAAATNIDEEEDIGDEIYSAIEIYPSEDAHLLRCRPTILSDGGDNANAQATQTILGINELHGVHRDVPVRVSILEPCYNSIFDKISLEETSCCCQHPRGDWERRHLHQSDRCVDNLTHITNLTMIDFTKVQDLRRSIDIERNMSYPCIDTPGKVFHFLRSILNCNHHGGGLHCASPWIDALSNTSANGREDCGAYDEVVALLVNDPYNNQAKESIIGSAASEKFWDDIENGEIDQLLHFRTGDAAPSYFLHSTVRLSGDIFVKLNELSSPETAASNCSSRTTVLLVYRHLTPRDILSHRSLNQEMKYKGCLMESYFGDVEETEVDMGEGAIAGKMQRVKHRMVSPPYLSHVQEYPGLLDSLLENIDTLRNEARTIPQWTAWPEKSHYAENSWNVFPLCYTFPANELSKRKFVDQTCSFVPETTRLLHTLGPALRTALFSRLDAGSRLGAHTGWEDLANHVLRLHIPLIVPGSSIVDDSTRPCADNYNMGLCGIWVDGCVDTHEEGRIIVFDDSKAHRAFNYSDGERIVLIIDLARPQGLPMGTATGGHSDELDDFISGF